MRTHCGPSVFLGLLAVSATVVFGGDVQTDGRFVSTVPIGPPFEVVSTGVVSNLNVDMLDSYDTATAYSAAAHIYVSTTAGKLPEGTVDDDSIDDVFRRIFFAAHQIDPAYSLQPPVKSQPISSATPALAFHDTDINYVQLVFQVPDDWDASGSFDVRLLWAASATTGDVVWDAMFTALTDDEALDTVPSSLTGVTSAASTNSHGRVRTSPISISAGSLAIGDLVTVLIQRSAGDSLDDLSGYAYLTGVEISYLARR